MYGNKKNPSLTRNVEIPLSYFMLLRKNIHQGQRIKYSENTLRYGGRSIRILYLSPNSNFCHSLFVHKLKMRPQRGVWSYTKIKRK